MGCTGCQSKVVLILKSQSRGTPAVRDEPRWRLEFDRDPRIAGVNNKKTSRNSQRL